MVKVFSLGAALGNKGGIGEGSKTLEGGSGDRSDERAQELGALGWSGCSRTDLRRDLEHALTEDSGSIEADRIPPKAGQGVGGVGWDGEVAEALQEAWSAESYDLPARRLRDLTCVRT